MPTYDFKCNDSGKYFQVRFKTYEEYDNATITSPFTGTQNVTRIIKGVNVAKSESSRFDRLIEGDEQALSELDPSDPAMLGRALRHMGSQTGEDLGDEFDEVVDRLESGDSPEAIEESMSDLGTDI